MSNKIIKFGRKCFRSGLIMGAGGNISERTERGVSITSTGSQLQNLKKKDIVNVTFTTNEENIVAMDPTGKQSKIPSKECILHFLVYAERPDVHAIIHVHPTYSILNAGNTLRNLAGMEGIHLGYVPYYLAGSTNLARSTQKQFLAGADVVVQENHGIVVGAKSLRQALIIAETYESCAKISFLSPKGNQ